MILEQATELGFVFAGNERGMIQGMLASDYHKGDQIPHADYLQAHIYTNLLEQPVSKHIKTHRLPFHANIDFSLKYNRRGIRVNKPLKKPMIHGSYQSLPLEILAIKGRYGDLGVFQATFK